MTQEQTIDISTYDDASLLEALDAGLFDDTPEGEVDSSGDTDANLDNVSDDDDEHLEEDSAEESSEEDNDNLHDDDFEDEDLEEEEEDVEEDSEEDLEEEEESSEEVPESTLREVYDKLFAPFRAANQTVQISNVDEAIRLMQQGVDYYKKTRELAKYSRTVHMLEKNGLTSDEDIGYIIDLVNKDPKAIQKLLKDSDIDLMDLDLDSESDYKPSKPSISDQELELRMIMTRNIDNQEFQNVVNDVRDWDTASRQMISDHPQLLEILSEDYASGAYQQVMSEITKRQALGQTNGLSMIQAYRQVVEEWSAPTNSGKQSTKSNPQPKANDSDRQRRRKSASPAPRTVSKTKVNVLDTPQELYAMSDDDLDKLLNL